MTDLQQGREPQRPERALVIVAHPDDADFLASGTMARWAREGVDVILVVITDGSKGSEDPDMTRDRLVAIREAEQRAAAACLGARDVVFLGYEDGALVDDMALRRDLTRLIRQYRPERVVCMDPTVRWFGSGYINHPDHIAGASAALAAISLLSRNRPSFPELAAAGLLPHKAKYLYLGSTATPDTWIDIGDTIDLKVQALRQHKSQLNGDEIEPMIREWARRDAEGHGMEYAESFRLFKLD
jgi:LmbE family N-acetylglucosaminyl deacetylase